MSVPKDDSEMIRAGQYVIIQRQDYKKLHKFSNASSCASLGRDVVELGNIENCLYFSTFKMIPTGKGKNRKCVLEKCDLSCLTLKNNIPISQSGDDNRNITDDGRSQKLSKDEIEALREQSLSSSDIVSTLISNSNTFHAKTEYSQEKYLKKKEKKYFEFIQIRKPTIRLICDIMYRKDPAKVMGIRTDTLSQLLTYCNLSGNGYHLLYDSGTNGLVAAAILNSIGANTEGQLIHMHPGNCAQKQALLAMNFPESQYSRCISVNLYSVLRHLYQNDAEKDVENGDEPMNSNNAEDQTQTNIEELKTRKRKLSSDESENDTNKLAKKDVVDGDINNESQRDSNAEKRTPKWELENERACVLLRNKVDSLIITAKEHPLSIFKFLLPMVNISRPFVIYHYYQEPLQECYIALRKMSNVVGVKMVSNWMRGYQVLQDRTHPDVLMQSNSGFLLTGWIVQ